MSRSGHGCLSLVFICCVVLCRQRPLRRADHSSRGVLPCVQVYEWSQKPRKGPLVPVGKYRKMNVGLMQAFSAFLKPGALACRLTGRRVTNEGNLWKLHGNLLNDTNIHVYVLLNNSLLLRVQEVPGSYIGLETGYPEWDFLWFTSVPPGVCRVSTLNFVSSGSFHILYNSSFTYNPIIHPI
jgi:hypothetical protein